MKEPLIEDIQNKYLDSESEIIKYLFSATKEVVDKAISNNFISMVESNKLYLEDSALGWNGLSKYKKLMIVDFLNYHYKNWEFCYYISNPNFLRITPRVKINIELKQILGEEK